MSELLEAAKRLLEDGDDDTPWGEGELTVTVSIRSFEKLRAAVAMFEQSERLRAAVAKSEQVNANNGV